MSKVSLGKFIVNPVKFCQETTGESTLVLTHPGVEDKVLLSRELYNKLVANSTKLSWLEWWRS